MTEHVTLEEAVSRYVNRGDSLHIVCGHSRWTAAAREVVRQFWGQDAGFELVMLSLSSLGALFFRGKMLRRAITCYCGDSFPTYSPNPIFQAACASGQVELEHWSFLSYVQRLEAAARGLPGVVTGSLTGSFMHSNPGVATVASPFGSEKITLLAPLVPDIALMHGAVADRAGNVAVSEPLLEGVWGAWAARRGVIATVDAVVESLAGLGHRVKVPAHRVLAVVEAPLGAHPGGIYAPDLPVDSYGEDIPFWIEARDAARGDFDAWARQWVLDPVDQRAYLSRLGAERIEHLRARADPESWRDDAAQHPVDAQAPPTPWERSAALAARELGRVIDDFGADAVLAGAGVANLASWVAVERARREGRRVLLTAELGMLGYLPTPADPYIFNQRVFPSASMLSDASTVLGMMVGGPGTITVACLGAAEVDRHGNLNSTMLGGGRLLVGSGGANDVATRADACVAVTLARPGRLVESCAFITGPGERVVSVVTELGILRRLDGELRVGAVCLSPNEPDLAASIRQMVSACAWDVPVCPEVEVLEAVTPDEVLALRRYDPEGLFLS